MFRPRRPHPRHPERASAPRGPLGPFLSPLHGCHPASGASPLRPGRSGEFRGAGLRGGLGAARAGNKGPRTLGDPEAAVPPDLTQLVWTRQPPSGGWGPAGRTLLGPGPGGRPPEVTPPLKPTDGSSRGSALSSEHSQGTLAPWSVGGGGGRRGSLGFSQVASIFRGTRSEGHVESPLHAGGCF